MKIEEELEIVDSGTVCRVLGGSVASHFGQHSASDRMYTRSQLCASHEFEGVFPNQGLEESVGQ